tara:strand:- start:269 stop:463 length:195 start_codon:yes stop_codon:yes gene_type:complete
MRLPRFKDNLWVVGDKVCSYGVPVARIEDDILQQLKGIVSVTTQRHINYVAEHLKLKLRKPKNK